MDAITDEVSANPQAHDSTPWGAYSGEFGHPVRLNPATRSDRVAVQSEP